MGGRQLMQVRAIRIAIGITCWLASISTDAAIRTAAAAEGTAQTYRAEDCEQTDSNVTALRACTALLDAGNIDDATRARYLVRRGYAWLADDDGGDGAKEDFTRALQTGPANVKALKGRAKAHTLLGQHDLAAADWSAILATSPDAKETEAALMSRGAAHQAAGQQDQALADYARALELNPKSEAAHIARAAVFAARNDRASVLKEYELARAINGGSYDFYIARAQIAESWGETQSAIDHYQAALNIDPRRAWTARKSLKRLGVDYPSE
jgi:tetratricopeptide (TPR) repeat protein